MRTCSAATRSPIRKLPAIIESGEVAAEEAIPAIRAALAPA
jgi:hypothetical protein